MSERCRSQECETGFKDKKVSVFVISLQNLLLKVKLKFCRKEELVPVYDLTYIGIETQKCKIGFFFKNFTKIKLFGLMKSPSRKFVY